ncbi:CGNR zinc finger domain-containing protein [Mycolicibacterium sp. 050232]|uniref:CGNR zinc finger domain-containing protein n=1 Tax=Mycolicibacterium sp. 050232 TaxID=3113982 RepID=UPI002E2D4213|nr:CGNR zinc finger domain-containing protein [Mycolicibacterium sp. 050232]MED5814917.1 CGNR zinc finger domain-containing protein [Mycolicibacterium sp. 050232]
MRDPRPHVGEPLALDLLNTRWMSADGPQDLLADVDGLKIWLLANGLADRCEADETARTALVSAREAILQALQPGSTDELNEVLERGRIRRTLTASGPAEVAEVEQPEWLAAWLAADGLLRLLGDAPGRIKQCAHPHCILWFHDTSKNGARRWHSMATCGNRAKAARHYAAKRD